MAHARRHYGMDWLRIAAFGLLILYHIGMVFAPWDWVIKSANVHSGLVAPMAALTPWRLALLFAVSGYASRALWNRSDGAGGFVASRNRRLLIPLAFGMAVLVVPEVWIFAQEHGYRGSLLAFWTGAYWRVFPSWEHLWFVLYLWAYTLAIAVLAAWIGVAALDRAAAWLAAGARLLWWPLAGLIGAKLAMMFVVPEQSGLFVDWTAHAEYLPVMLFGFVLAGGSGLWPAVLRLTRPAAAVALAAGAVVVGIELAYQGHATPGHALMAFDRAARLAMAWSMILVCFALAERLWNRDHLWRAPLAEAVFPAYLVHQAAIVVIAWYTLPLGLSAPVEFALLLAGTAATCAATYLVGREIGWLRPLIGLSPRPPAAARRRRWSVTTG